MSRIERFALVRCPAQQVFELVDDVAAYPRRFGWCESSEVLSRSESERIARLDLRMAGLRTSFTTRNQVVPGERIRLGLVDGPFTALSGEWNFQALTEHACKVSLLLDFEVAGRLMGSALATGFRSLADRLVDDFVREAKRQHGG